MSRESEKAQIAQAIDLLRTGRRASNHGAGPSLAKYLDAYCYGTSRAKVKRSLINLQKSMEWLSGQLDDIYQQSQGDPS